MSDKQYYVFIERNDNEGETWCFYVPLTEAEADHLIDVLEAADSDIQETYTLLSPLPESVVDILVEHGNVVSGYMDPHTKCTGCNTDILDIQLDISSDDLVEIFYKGQCWTTK